MSWFLGAAVAVLLDPDNLGFEVGLPSIETAARALGLQLVSVTLESERHLDAAFARIVATGAGAMLFGGGPVLRSQLDQVVALAARHAIPTIYELRDYVQAGGLISYAASFTGAYRQAGIYAGRILKGASRPNCRSAADQVRAGDQPQNCQALGLRCPTSCSLPPTR
jgi:putative ABC transport system substrate-binding protein